MVTKAYYVSQDLEKIVARWCAKEKLSAPARPFFDELRTDLERELQHAFRDEVEGEAGEKYRVAIKPIRIDQFSELRRKRGDRSEFWIALDDITVPSFDYHLQVTRIYDRDARKLGVGSRNGAKTILQQIADCQAKYGTYSSTKDRPTIVLADDGAYEGGSILDIARRLKQQNLSVSKVKLGFATGKGYDAIRKAMCPPEFDEHVTISVSHSQDIEGVHVWVCERDFYLGVPRGGRTYGVPQQPDGAAPHDLPISFPYVEPFAVSRGGGSMAVGKFSFGRAQIEASIRLWSEIQKVNGGQIFLVEDIPRFPGPGLEGEQMLHAKTPWLEYIKKVAAITFSDIAG